MKLKLSCTDFSFPLLEHDQALAVIAMLGFRGADIGLFEGHGHLKPSRELRKPAQNGAKLKQKLAAHGLQAADIFLQIHADFTEYALNHPEPKRRELARTQFSRTLEYAQAAGAEHVTLLPGMRFRMETRVRSVGRSVEELHWRVAEAKAAGLQVAVEPHVDSLINTPERARNLLEQVPGLGCTLDYAHFTCIGITDQRIATLWEFATHAHARAARRDWLQTRLAKNTINFPAALAGLARHKFKGWMALEYVWIDWERCNQVDVISETLELKKLLAAAAKSK